MPNIAIKVPRGAFDRAGLDRLVQGVTAAAKEAEQIGDAPNQTFLIWVTVDESEPGCFTAGGSDPLTTVLPVSILFTVPAGVMDMNARAIATDLIHKAAWAARTEGDRRPVLSSVQFCVVESGYWGINGTLWDLADFVKAAGYRHLGAGSH